MVSDVFHLSKTLSPTNPTLLCGVTEGIFSYLSGKPVARAGNSVPKGASESIPMSWNEFQSANAGKYTKAEMSEA